MTKNLPQIHNVMPSKIHGNFEVSRTKIIDEIPLLNDISLLLLDNCSFLIGGNKVQSPKKTKYLQVLHTQNEN